MFCFNNSLTLISRQRREGTYRAIVDKVRMVNGGNDNGREKRRESLLELISAKLSGGTVDKPERGV